MIILAPLLWTGCEEEIPSNDVDNTITILPYNGPRLSERDSWTYDREEGLVNKWFAHLEGDSVVIEREGLCGSSCEELYRLILFSRGTALPAYRGCAYLKKLTYPVARTITDSLVSGEIRIQDWDLTSIVAGSVTGRWRSGDSLSFIFWADVLAEQVDLVISDYYGYQYPLIDSLDAFSIPESVRGAYREDADRLTVNIMQNLGGEAAASTQIPAELAYTVYQALLHVYAADNLAARDSVVSLYDIHTWPDPEMNHLLVSADSTTIWMQAWKQNYQTTGQPIIDSLVALYDLEVVDYIRGSSKSSEHTAVLLSSQRLNMAALGDLFEQIEGMDYAGPEEVFGDGPDIEVRPGENTWQVDFTLGWGNCLNGCINRHTWTFVVSYDGGVDFLDSSGPEIPAVLD